MTWTPSDGSWTLVVMNSDGTPGIAVTGDAAATAPGLARVADRIALAGLLLLAGGLVMVLLPIARATRAHGGPWLRSSSCTDCSTCRPTSATPTAVIVVPVPGSHSGWPDPASRAVGSPGVEPTRISLSAAAVRRV